MLAPPLSTGDGSSVLEGRRHSESKTQTESMQSQLSLCFSASKSRGAVLHSIFFPLFPPTFPVSPSPRIFLSSTSFQNVDFFFSFTFLYNKKKSYPFLQNTLFHTLKTSKPFPPLLKRQNLILANSIPLLSSR